MPYPLVEPALREDCGTGALNLEQAVPDARPREHEHHAERNDT